MIEMNYSFLFFSQLHCHPNRVQSHLEVLVNLVAVVTLVAAQVPASIHVS